MLTPLDEYLIHQTPDPISKPGTTDPNFYDRYWFNGYDREGEFYFGIALGLYPNRRVLDGSFSFVSEGVQDAVHGSRLAPDDRAETSVGPLRIEVIEPMRAIRVVVERGEADLAADLVYRPRTACVEEVRSPLVRDRRTMMDTTRFTQMGTWEGVIERDGRRHDVSPERTYGTRDRSWGVRPVGEPAGGRPMGEPQIFFLWAPLQFDDCCTHAATFEMSDGQPWDNHARVMPAYAKPEELPGIEDPGTRSWLGVKHEIDWQPGTRWAQQAKLTFVAPDGADETIEIVEPLLRFQMHGLGYVHPEWGLGLWKGDLAVGAERWKIADIDPLDPRFRHVQQVVRARWGERTGVGVMEQIVFGPYPRYGFEGMMDGAR